MSINKIIINKFPNTLKLKSYRQIINIIKSNLIIRKLIEFKFRNRVQMKWKTVEAEYVKTIISNVWEDNTRVNSTLEIQYIGGKIM